MTDIAKQGRIAQTLNAEIGRWLPEDATVLWANEKFFDGDYLEKQVFAVDTDDGSVTVLRAWMNGENGPPAVSVDLSVPYDTFAGDIDDDAFPHRSSRGGHSAMDGEKDPKEFFLRAKLLGEDVEIIWQNASDSQHSSFIARTAKVGRDEHVIAGTVAVENGIASVDLGFRQELASLKPAVRRAMSR